MERGYRNFIEFYEKKKNILAIYKKEKKGEKIKKYFLRLLFWIFKGTQGLNGSLGYYFAILVFFDFCLKY